MIIYSKVGAACACVLCMLCCAATGCRAPVLFIIRSQYVVAEFHRTAAKNGTRKDWCMAVPLASSSTLQKTERITILKCCDTAKLESLLHARIWWGTQFGGGDGAGGRRCRIRQCISAGGDSDTQGSSLGYEGCWGFVSSGCRGGRGGEGIGDGWWCDEAPLPRVDGGLVPAVAAASKC
jgi:hypothetical protein